MSSLRRAVAIPLLPAVVLKAGLCMFLFAAKPAADVPPCHKSQKQEQCLNCCKVIPGVEVDAFSMPAIVPLASVRLEAPRWLSVQVATKALVHEDCGKTYLRTRSLLI